jgi:hypothetical protein
MPNLPVRNGGTGSSAMWTSVPHELYKRTERSRKWSQPVTEQECIRCKNHAVYTEIMNHEFYEI